MKKFYYLILIFSIAACVTHKQSIAKTSGEEKAVVIANDSLAYKIIILDIGFNTYLNSIAQPMHFYSEAYYKLKNDFYVNEWNRNVLSSNAGFRNLFEQTIDYDPSIDYGLEVNYKLFNYFKFVEYKYRYKFNF